MSCLEALSVTILISHLQEPSSLSLQIFKIPSIISVDSNDWGHVSEAQEELQQMLNEDELCDALLLVFANKHCQDLPNAINAAEITD